MVALLYSGKNPKKVAAGRDSARRRWGRRRHVRLDTLPEPVRRAIETMIAAEELAREREKADEDSGRYEGRAA